MDLIVSNFDKNKTIKFDPEVFNLKGVRTIYI